MKQLSSLVDALCLERGDNVFSLGEANERVHVLLESSQREDRHFCGHVCLASLQVVSHLTLVQRLLSNMSEALQWQRALQSFMLLGSAGAVCSPVVAR